MVNPVGKILGEKTKLHCRYCEDYIKHTEEYSPTGTLYTGVCKACEKKTGQQ